MPRTAVVAQQISRAALTPAFVTPDAAGSSFQNDGTPVLHVKTGGTGTTVTIPIPNTVDGQTVASKSYVIGTTSERLIGPFPAAIYNQASGEVFVDYSSITTVTVAVYRPQ